MSKIATADDLAHVDTLGFRGEALHAMGAVSSLVLTTCERGVEILDLPDLNTVDGIADIGFAFAAWFVDPHRNSIGLLQFKAT